MRLSELDYNLPPELIAQEPLLRRDEARLLVLDRRGGTIEHSRFYKTRAIFCATAICWCSTIPGCFRRA